MERWLPIAGHDGYEVSDLGRVRSVDRTVVDKIGRSRFHRGRVLNFGTLGKGYVAVRLGWRQPLMYVHRLVLEAFVGPCPPQNECLHGPGGPADNRLTNLRWGTRSENSFDALRDGTHVSQVRSVNPKGT